MALLELLCPAGQSLDATRRKGGKDERNVETNILKGDEGEDHAVMKKKRGTRRRGLGEEERGEERFSKKMAMLDVWTDWSYDNKTPSQT